MEDGREVRVRQMIFNHRVYIEKPGAMSYDDCWCYDDAESAILAVMAWDNSVDPEPKGWKKHPATGRRNGSDVQDDVDSWD